MTSYGFTLSSEELGPNDLIETAVEAEQGGFDFLSISDHFHPWVDAQGSSPFVWATLGGVATATERIAVMTGVTCPTTRIHPAIVAQAAATTAVMFEGRFSLGVGTGEALNEHITGERWPETPVRQDRLVEAVEVIRMLWDGGLQSHHGEHYTVENARIYTLPEQPPPIVFATAGERATEIAGRHGDGMFGLIPEAGVVSAFEEAGGEGKPRYGQVHVCWAEDEAKARKTALEGWPNAAVGGNLSWELPLPSHFEDASAWAGEDDIAESVVCGPDPEQHIAAIREFEEAGYDHVYVHQVGPEQKGCIDFYESSVLPALRG